ncbi:MAG: hypothetical protein DRN04_06845 [Thermoprotei archaeon]|nr:MAG: hypothetical protein DRN04_06845 [Thermoprotei archaeon]
MTLKVALSLVLNAHYRGYIYEKIDELIEVYKSVLRLIDKYGFKATLFISGATAEAIGGDEELLKIIKDGLKKGHIEVCNTTFSYAILAKLPLKEAREQVKLANETLAQVFEEVSKGFYPPESFFDPLLPMILRELDFSWILLDPEKCRHEYGEVIPHVPLEFRGVNESKIRGVFLCNKWSDLKHLMMLDELPPPPRLVTVMFSEKDIFTLGEAEKKLVLLKALSERIEAESVLVTEYIEEVPPAEEAVIGSPNPLWRLEELWNEARESIRILESLARTKQSVDAFTLLNKAIRSLYLSETSSTYYESRNKTGLLELYSCEKALEAISLARQALKILS